MGNFPISIAAMLTASIPVLELNSFIVISEIALYLYNFSPTFFKNISSFIYFN